MYTILHTFPCVFIWRFHAYSPIYICAWASRAHTHTHIYSHTYTVQVHTCPCTHTHIYTSTHTHQHKLNPSSPPPTFQTSVSHFNVNNPSKAWVGYWLLCLTSLRSFDWHTHTLGALPLSSSRKVSTIYVCACVHTHTFTLYPYLYTRTNSCVPLQYKPPFQGQSLILAALFDMSLGSSELSFSHCYSKTEKVLPACAPSRYPPFQYPFEVGPVHKFVHACTHTYTLTTTPTFLNVNMNNSSVSLITPL